MNRITVLLVVGFALAFAAGGSVGMLAVKDESRPPPREFGHPLDRELALTPQQREQMGKIWSEVMDGADRKLHERMRALWDRRQKALEGLLTEEQRAQYDKILDEINQGMQQIERERQQQMQALQNIRRQLARSAGSGGVLLLGVAPPRAGLDT